MRRRMLPRWALLFSALYAGFIAYPGAGHGECPSAPEGEGRGRADAACILIEGTDLVCYPSVLHSREGRWTFLLRGNGAFEIDHARLDVAGAEYPTTRLAYPSPSAVLIDFEYPLLQVRETAHLILEMSGRELARVPVPVTRGEKIPPARRQKHLVRVQMRPWTLLYPLHGFRGDHNVKDRQVVEIAGDEEFLAVLHDMDIRRIRKVIARHAEDDSIRWDPRFHRENVYHGEQLRQYIMYIDPNRSEAAFLEIFLGFEQVQGAFINEDRSKK